MKYLFNSRLGDTRYRMSDGSLLCKDVPIARTGKQLYGAADFPELEPDADGEIVVERMADEVFSPEAMASFEGMAVTLLHPEDDRGNILFVDKENWHELAVGHVSNIRQRDDEPSGLLIADLIIKDEIAIAACERCPAAMTRSTGKPDPVRQYSTRSQVIMWLLSLKAESELSAR
ncbi:hypothetical protein SODG_007595 [Sodalis praecaptivus]